MKPLLVLARITFVGCLWSIIFIEGVRVIVLENWHFDIFWPPHWAYAWNLWQSGWIIDTRKEWAFVLILLTFIPLWLMGWIVLSLVPWETILYNIICFPFRLFGRSVKPLTRVVTATPVITKKKSYKEVRPVGKRVPIYDYNTTSTPVASATPTSSESKLPVVSNPVKDRAVATREALNHTIFDLDDEEDDFDLDIDSFDKADIFKIDSNKKSKESRRFNEEEAEYETPRAKKSKPRKASFEYDEEDDFEDDEAEYRQRRTKSAPSQRRTRYDMEDEDDDDLETYQPVRYNKKAKSRMSVREEDNSPRYERQRRRSENEFNERSERREKTGRSADGAVSDILQDRGYDVIRNVSVGSNVADYVAVSADKMLVCVVDKEHGDWLADEERFNDEDPLWFSENSHRISPVRKADVMAGKIQDALENTKLNVEVKPCVIVVAANIINAEDMIDVWKDLDVDVVRFAKGGPTDLMPFAKMLKPANENLEPEELSKLKKVLQKLS